MNAWLIWAFALAVLVAVNLAAVRLARRMGGRTRAARRFPNAGGGPARPSVDELLERMDWAWRREEEV
ncbi:MAG TPA: hypothetical protein VJN72_07195 [Gaiellales bacterium]|nr:hypothetical protein [Gaiellales bacterium]